MECQHYKAIVPRGCRLLVGHCSSSCVPGCAQAAIALLLEGHVPTMEAAQAFLVNSDPPQIDIAEELARLGIYKVLSQPAIRELGCSLEHPSKVFLRGMLHRSLPGQKDVSINAIKQARVCSCPRTSGHV